MYAEVSRLKCPGALARLAFINFYRNRNHSDRDKLPNSDNRHHRPFRAVGVPAAGGISQTSSGVYERGHWSPEGQGTFSQFGSVTRGSRAGAVRNRVRYSRRSPTAGDLEVSIGAGRWSDGSFLGPSRWIVPRCLGVGFPSLLVEWTPGSFFGCCVKPACQTIPRVGRRKVRQLTSSTFPLVVRYGCNLKGL